MTEDVFRWVVAAAVILACLAFVVQAGAALAMYRIAKRMQGKIVPLAARAEPILDAAQGILVDNRPRILEISGEAVAMAKTARQQVDQWSVVLDDAAGRARVRIAQIDETVDETVQHVEDVSGAVKGAVLRPVREANGLMAGLKAAVSTYVHGGRRSSVDHATQDEEMFI